MGPREYAEIFLGFVFIIFVVGWLISLTRPSRKYFGDNFDKRRND